MRFGYEYRKDQKKLVKKKSITKESSQTGKQGENGVQSK